MLQGEHSAILLTFIKLPFIIKIFVSFLFEWPLKTGFTVLKTCKQVPPQTTKTVAECVILSGSALYLLR